MDYIPTIVGFVLFGVSEILPFINIPTNGFVHTLLLGVTNSFKNPSKDVEMASVSVKDQHIANLVNVISTSPQIKNLVESTINNPQLANIVYSINGNNQILSQLIKIISNPQLLSSMLDDPQFFNIISLLTSSIDYKKLQDPKTIKLLSILTDGNSQGNNKSNLRNIISTLSRLNDPKLIETINDLVMKAQNSIMQQSRDPTMQQGQNNDPYIQQNVGTNVDQNI